MEQRFLEAYAEASETDITDQTMQLIRTAQCIDLARMAIALTAFTDGPKQQRFGIDPQSFESDRDMLYNTWERVHADIS